MIIGMVPMAMLPGQNVPGGRAVAGRLPFATYATPAFVPTMLAFVHGATNPSAIPAGA
jgi:hypothetical protein